MCNSIAILKRYEMEKHSFIIWHDAIHFLSAYDLRNLKIKPIT